MSEDEPDPFEQLSRQETEEYLFWTEQVEKRFNEIFGGQDAGTTESLTD